MGKLKKIFTPNLTTIKDKILRVVVLIVLISLSAVGIISCSLNYYSTNKTLEQTMTAAAKVAAERIEWQLLMYKEIVFELGTSTTIANSSVKPDIKKEVIQQKVEYFNLAKGDLLAMNGLSIFDSADYSQEAFFQRALNGETVITSPVQNKGDEIEIKIAAPLWKDGDTSGQIIGVIVITPQKTFLNDITNSIQVSDNGYAYMLNQDGYVIAHKNEELVTGMDNSIEDAKTNSSVKSVAKLEEEMVAGKTGFGKYRYNGVSKILTYAPVANTDGWSVAINAPSNDFMSETYVSLIITIICLVVSIALSYKFASDLANNIGGPIHQCSERLKLLANGDLNAPVPEIHTNDETSILADATAHIVGNLSCIIQDVSYTLTEMAKGNFNITSSAKEYYVGDFQPIFVSVETILHSLNHTLKNITEAADQVAAGSGQLAQSSTDLAYGSTEQAGVVEELFATITDFTTQVQSSADAARTTSKQARNIGEEAKNSSNQMVLMNQAMQRISDASNEISNIIETIEAIALQTDLLSLNASIEAAKAGERGNGFAVVAHEIGELAKQCGDAVEVTRQLIQSALSEVNNGTQITNQTITSLNHVIEQIGVVVEQIEQVADNTESQAETMLQLNQGVEQIAGVVENNSATAEECSATSEELSAQATSLDDLVGQFTLSE